MTTEQIQAMPERIYAETKGTSRIWRPWYEQADVPTGDCTEYVHSDLYEQALSIAKAAEQMAEALTSLMQYAKWQTTEGATYHPTLPSAIHAAENCLNTYNNAKNGG